MTDPSFHVAALGNVTQGSAVIAGHGAVLLEAASNVIYVNIVDLSDCMQSRELQLSIGKRFSNRRFRSMRTVVPTIVYGVLCTQGYRVNHSVLCGVDYEFMAHVWEFIQTARVSSSPGLRSLLSRLLGSRTYNGYMSTFPRDCYRSLDRPERRAAPGQSVFDDEWTSIDVEQAHSCTSFFEVEFTDAVLARIASSQAQSPNVRALCLDALHGR